ncbi:MAG: prepilin-type N-terminal cleavage/methylation domain-containing protein [Nitrospirae bacterium]|nr:prepilin-type N-terminal cleavage/methylation domain-containing protein [Nitrospirota bacterium]
MRKATVAANLRSVRGFTLIELVVIIVIVVLLAAAAVPRLANMTGMKASASARRLQSDMAYAQNLSMSQNQRFRIVFLSTTSYEVRDQSGVLATNPDGGAGFVVTTDAGITLSWLLNADAAINRGVEFDGLGRPYLYAGITPSITDLVNGTVTVTGGPPPPQTVTVQPQTGRVSTP